MEENKLTKDAIPMEPIAQVGVTINSELTIVSDNRGFMEKTIYKFSIALSVHTPFPYMVNISNENTSNNDACLLINFLLKGDHLRGGKCEVSDEMKLIKTVLSSSVNLYLPFSRQMLEYINSVDMEVADLGKQMIITSLIDTVKLMTNISKIGKQNPWDGNKEAKNNSDLQP